MLIKDGLFIVEDKGLAAALNLLLADFLTKELEVLLAD